jgi:transcriptional regulator GlxA family with amidase domain
MAKERPHRVVVVAVPPAVSFDLAIPDLVFRRTVVAGGPGYDVRVCTADPGPVRTDGGFDALVPLGLDAIDDADTVIVTGVKRFDPFDRRVLDALRAAAARGARLASICTGAFVLAEAGLLDGLPATTHWRQADEFRARYPAVELRPDVLFVDSGQILTSAGLAAGIDLCLHLVRTDHGAAVANRVARRIVVSPVRPGGQAQFIAQPLPPERDNSLAATRAWVLERLDVDLTLADLARHAALSVRTLTRRFRDETGLSPIQWLLHQRVERARELLEATTLPVDQVARRSGLGTRDSLRQHMRQRVGLTPTAYRTAFTRTAGGK